MNKLTHQCPGNKHQCPDYKNQCPLGGDETDDCADCAYSCDYHFVDGECVLRNCDDE